jgi:hypothetical protein
MLRKEIRKKIVDTSEYLLRKSGFADKTVSVLLQVLHISVALFSIYLLFFGSRMCFFIVAALNLIVYCLFYIFEGCLLTRIEQRFIKNGNTVIDPLLLFFHIESTNANRYTFSSLSNIFGAVATYGIYYYRFANVTQLSVSEADMVTEL